MRERKLRIGVNWKGAVKQEGLKQGLRVFTFKMLHAQPTKVILFH
jgi:hypothetical protein